MSAFLAGRGGISPGLNGRPADPPPRPRWETGTPLTQLAPGSEVVDWKVDGMLAAGHLTTLTALYKTGKTTFMALLLKARQTGAAFLGRETKPGATYIVSEESKSLWAIRRDEYGLDDSTVVLCKPMFAKPDFGTWGEFVDHVHDDAKAHGCDTVIFDTIAAVAPWRNENDSAEIIGAVTPLNKLTAAGFAIAFSHHAGYGDRQIGQASRGSSAINGNADIVLELRRYKPNDLDDRRRVLNGLGRFDCIPSEIVIELAADGSGYTASGDRKAAAARDLYQRLRDTLPPDPPGLTAKDVHEELPKDDRPRRGDVSRELQKGANRGDWQTAGEGTSRDPRRFWGVRVPCVPTCSGTPEHDCPKPPVSTCSRVLFKEHVHGEGHVRDAGEGHSIDGVGVPEHETTGHSDDSFPIGANAPPVELPPHPNEAVLVEWNQIAAAKKKSGTVAARGKRRKRPRAH
jgi:hypothetical protein